MPRLVALLCAVGCTAHNFSADQDLSVTSEDMAVNAPDLAVPPNMAADLAGADLAGADFAGADFAGVDLAGADLATAGDDLATGPDLAGADLLPAITTAHAIDTDQLGNGAPVQVAGLVLTGVPRVEGTTSNNHCIYGAYAQDPAGAAPSGLRLFVIADLCVPSDMGPCRCAQPPSTGTLFDVTSTLGDVLTVTGTVDIFGIPAQHSVRVSTLDKIGTGGVITPLDITDPIPFAKNGTGYVTDESMLVAIHPAAPFTISALDNRGNFTGGGAQFSGIYRFYYPAPAGTFSSITGVAQISFGGVAPRVQADFVP
jgi:Pentapeptide repeats (8 copies)